MFRFLIHILIPTVLMLCAEAVNAQAGPPVDGGPVKATPSKAMPEPRSFGVASETVHVLQAYAFEPFSSQDDGNFEANIAGSRYCTSLCFVEAPLMLPAGAAIEAVELEGCDGSDQNQITAKLFRIEALEADFETLATAPTGGTSTPGCSFFVDDLDPAPTVDNLNNSYMVQVHLPSSSTGQVRFQAVRVYYRRQISPAPGTATFNDVLTGHPFFQHIEALAASGITAGCGGGDFCPGDPVTRGQMAVFLAAALGLHWAP